MGEQHLDAFAITARLPASCGASECTGGIASVFVDAARDFALRRLWTAFRLQRARATIIGPCAIEESLPIVNFACRAQELAPRAHIDMAILVERESCRLNEPSSRLDLSMTGMCGAIFFSLTTQLSVAADPYAVSAARHLG